MNKSEKKLLEAFSCAIKKKKYSISFDDNEESLRFFHLAMDHKILPMVIETLEEATKYGYYAKRARQETQTQACRSADFLLLYEYLLNKGLKPLVLKGIICRSLYPYPEERCSSDEDLWIEKESFDSIHEALLAYGLTLVNPDEDLEEAYEVAYEEKESLLYVEVHKDLFSPTSVYSYLNGFFEEAKQRVIREKIYRTEFYTLTYTDHLLYLILHAYKHFLHSGFGIRQVGDILLYSIEYKNEIDWKKIKEDLLNAKAYDLSCAIYKIALNNLIYDVELAEILKTWDIDSIEEGDLLDDIIKSGIYGASSFARLHTSTMTLNALNKNNQASLISSVFLPLSSMETKYPYLKKKPYLLPLAWLQRIIAYFGETKRIKNDDPKESIRLGKERIQLLKKYKIL